MTLAVPTIDDHLATRTTISVDRRKSKRHPSVIPGFGITLGLTLTWLALIVLIPLAGLFLKTAELSLDQFWSIVTSRRALNALRISFGVSLAAAATNLVFGLVVVWALVRYDFPLKRLRGCGRNARRRGDLPAGEGVPRRSWSSAPRVERSRSRSRSGSWRRLPSIQPRFANR